MHSGWGNSKLRKLLTVCGMYAALAVGASLSAFASGLNDDGLYAKKDWRLSFAPGIPDLLMVATHGTDVWGHELGFFMRWPICESKNLFVFISTYEQIEDNIEGLNFTFEFTVENRKFLIDLPLFSVNRWTPLLTVVRFTNADLPPELFSMLKSGKEVSIEMKAPTQLLGFFDIRKYEFSLEGFSDVADAAEKACLAGESKEGSGTYLRGDYAAARRLRRSPEGGHD